MKWFTDIVGCDILALAKAISFPNIVRWVEFNICETIYVAKAKCLLANSYSSCWVYLDVSVKPGASFSWHGFGKEQKNVAIVASWLR